jgi:[acyl-carrier-protein] S-malonyltransferase/trans-AT polyketide synthase/acyltransferase/oxidoreductase domain-containing protein
MTATGTSIVFPGQGTQRPGMGRDFHDWSPAARHAYDEASEALALDVAALCFGEDERLALTEYAQPAILATEVAMLRAVEAELGLEAACYGGHSLGEYTALVAAGVLPLADAVRLVRERGRLMQEAVPVGEGGMVAVVAGSSGGALDRDAIARAIEGLAVAIANDNSGTQVVLSGLASDLASARARASEILGERVRFVDLEVSAPFHSPLMAAIEPTFAELLERTRAHLDATRAALVTSNYSGSFHEPDDDAVIERLVRQISGTVRWRANMAALRERSERVIEIGPGRPLRAFFKTIGVDVQTITDVRSATRVALSGMER